MSKQASTDTDVLIETVLARVASHMTHLATRLALTEAAVNEHFEDALAQDLRAFKDVQNLDYLQQSINDTAALLNTLSEGCRVEMDLIEKLRLETTRALVLGEAAAETSDAGSVELF